MIKNLTELKKALKEGVMFKIVAHCCEEYVGDLRKVTLANTQGFYSVNAERVDKTTTANNGRGSVLWWSNAAFWSFENGLCCVYNSDKQHDSEHIVMAFRVFEESVV